MAAEERVDDISVDRSHALSGQTTRVLVLMGGCSAEREVSLSTGAQVAEALAASNHDVVTLDTAAEDFIEQIKAAAPDVVFICLHGRYGEDGTMQGLLELLGIPYVGSGVLASALAMDKVMSKRIYEQAGLPTPSFVVVRAGDVIDTRSIQEHLGDKTVVKPVCEGSSIGMTIAHSSQELPAAIEEALIYDDTVLVEAFIAGVEVAVGVLGNAELEVLPTLEIVPEHEFYDYEAKYVPGMSRHIIPARLSESVRAECQRISREAHRELGCRGMSRSDVIVTEDDVIYLLETNTIPGMTATSLLPEAARAAGIEFPQLCAQLVQLALEGCSVSHHSS